MWLKRAEPQRSVCCTVSVENVSLSDGENDPTTHLQLDHEEEYMDDDDITGVYGGSGVVVNSTISQLIRQLVEK